MDGQHSDKAQQPYHHHLGDALQALLQAEAAHQKANQYRQYHPKTHLTGVRQHRGPHSVDPSGIQPHKGARGKFHKITEHPTGNGGVVHHQQAAARHAEPAVNMPLASRLLQRLIAQHRALAAGPAHRQLHGEHRKGHDRQEQQIQQHEHAAAVLSRYIGKLPHVADAHGAPGADQNKAQPGAKFLSLQIHLSFMKTHPGYLSNFREKCQVPGFPVPAQALSRGKQEPGGMVKFFSRL